MEMTKLLVSRPIMSLMRQVRMEVVEHMAQHPLRRRQTEWTPSIAWHALGREELANNAHGLENQALISAMPTKAGSTRNTAGLTKSCPHSCAKSL